MHVIEINRTRTKFAAAAITVAYTLFYGLMPIILGNASDSRGLGEREIGFLASVYMGGQALGFFSGVFWIRALAWQPLLIGSGVAFAAGLFAASSIYAVTLLMACIFVAGAAAAVGYGVSIACIGDTDEPERWYAWAWFMQAIVGTGLAYLLPRLGDIGQDFNSSTRITAMLVLLLMPLALLLPNRGVKLGDLQRSSDGQVSSVNLALVFGLAVIVLVFIAESGLWSFLDRIAVAAGHNREFAGLVVALSFVGAAAGSSIAGIVSNRLDRLTPMAVSIVASIGAAWLFYLSDDRFSLLLAAFVYGAAWNIGAPYRMALVAEADVSGRFVTMIPGMQAIGSVIGPALAGVLVIDSSFALVYLAASIAWLLALVLFFVANKSLVVSVRRQHRSSTERMSYEVG
jgi:MFS family permease